MRNGSLPTKKRIRDNGINPRGTGEQVIGIHGTCEEMVQEEASLINGNEPS